MCHNFQSSYENRDRGVDDEERFAHKDNGGKKYEYVMKDYRKPIQRVYSQEPEHNEAEYGGGFGAIQVR